MILVTGGTGFLGSELIRQLLERGEKVRATRRSNSVIPALLSGDKKIEWVNADILDQYALEEALSGVKKVYHCAALISFDSSDYKNLKKVNIEGTANLVNLCLEKGIEKLVHVSSTAAVGKAKKGHLINEDEHWEPAKQNGYAGSKYESEMEVWRGIAEGLNAVVINPSIIIGKNAGIHGSGALFEIVRKGLKFYPSGSCGLIDVEDVARIMIHLMDSDIQSKRFILNAENYSYYDLFKNTALEFGLSPPARKISPWMLGFIWRMSKLVSLITGKEYGINKSIARSAFKNQEYSNEKIVKAVGASFKSVNESIREICAELDGRRKTEDRSEDL
jgi:dihydroflavonol-4-reductase